MHMCSSSSRGTWDVVCMSKAKAGAPTAHRMSGDQRQAGQADGAAAAFPHGARRLKLPMPRACSLCQTSVAKLVAPIPTRSVAAGASTAKAHEVGSSPVFPSVAAASSATTHMSPSSILESDGLEL